MKKELWIAVLCLALLLSGCGSGQSRPASSAASPAASAEAPQPANTEAPEAPSAETAQQQEALGQLLSWIREYMTIGTAGSSLRATAAASELLDWAAGCGLRAEEVAAAYEAWLPTMKEDFPVSFAEQLSAVDYMLQMLTEGDPEQAAALLSDAGCEDSGYPWGEQAIQVTDALMQAAGLR